ncbi:ABZJ_00895 family protein [uncultured Aliiroseovarius sp.]|uniref:ABZJ_00895 family protein n=1 Tax=uncultured Aliiroseovarius sp. TaxID=1658783 RepID=UPI002610585D|nr:ABZJ_00895 family protein [uncultured Aliiroseovarius sp.]
MNGTLNWKRYAGVYILSMIGLMILGLLLERLLGFSLPSGLSTVLPPMMAAMIEGQKRADAGLAQYENVEAWSAASSATMVVGVITVAVLAGLLILMPPMRQMFSSISMMTLVLVFAAIMGVTLLVNRFFLTLGYKNQRKALDKKASK